MPADQPDPTALRTALRAQLAGRQRSAAAQQNARLVRAMQAAHPDYRRWNQSRFTTPSQKDGVDAH